MKNKTVEHVCPVNTCLLRSAQKYGVSQRKETFNSEHLSQLHLFTDEVSEAKAGKMTC